MTVQLPLGVSNLLPGHLLVLHSVTEPSLLIGPPGHNGQIATLIRWEDH